MITQEQLQKILPKNVLVPVWFVCMQKFFPIYEINTPKRMAAFIAECEVESMGFTVFSENLYYTAQGLNKVFNRYFPTLDSAVPFAKQPEKIANKVYGNRLGNGPESTGDGYKYRGRGLFQLTGKSNYEIFAKFKNMSLDDTVAYLTTHEGAFESACHFWKTHNLNTVIDTQGIDAVSKIINGGTNGLIDRRNYFNSALVIIGEKSA
jgi:putative chitinase